jgi:predicted RNA-binding Zn-ribbon protein involved in translation (DUF1610 family)
MPDFPAIMSVRHEIHSLRAIKERRPIMAKFICQKCGEVTNSENSFTCKVSGMKHIWRSLPENAKKYICDECGEVTSSINSFSCKATGQRHIWRELKDQPKYICNKCGEKTSSINSFKCKATGYKHSWE